jgi:hypothetical protein
MLLSRLSRCTFLVPLLSRKMSSRPYSSSLEFDDNHSGDSPTNLHNDQRYKGRPFIGASEISNLINMNPHVSVGDAFERLWQKNNKRSFTKALARNELRVFTLEERMQEMGVLDIATAVVETDDPKEYREQMNEALKHAVTAQDKNVVRDFVNTSRGIKHEKKTFENLRQQDPTAGVSSDGNLYRKIINIPDSSLEYVISGYIDGIELNNNRIIEIKNRQNRLFNKVPMYEQVQCQAYLFLTGVPACEHTEAYRGRHQTTTLHFDPLFWAQVIERLSRVVAVYDVLIGDSNVQDTFLQTHDLFTATQTKVENFVAGRRAGQQEGRT